MDHTEDIEKLFSNKFDSFEVKTSKTEWITLNSKLKRLNFLKFSLASFNIYYLSLILILAGTTTYSTIHISTLHKKIQKLESQVQPNWISHSAPVNKKLVLTPNVPEKINESTASNSLPAGPDLKPKPVSKNNPAKTDTEKPHKNSPIDSLKSVPCQPADSTLTIRKIKKTVLIKHRSIIIKDTIFVPKP